MIVTVTFNPALDYLVYLPRFLPDELNRTEKESIVPGGKGLNVSVVLANLGVPSRALAFSAGFTGKEIQRLMENAGCETDFIPVEEGFSRINVKIKAGKEGEINGQGPKLESRHVEQLFRRLETLKAGDFLVLAGSIPGSLPPDLYQQILQRVEKQALQTVVDASGELLLRVLPYHPFLIKPNHLELGELFGRTLHTTEEISQCAQQLQEKGARNVLVSMAGDGAFLRAEDGREWFLPAPSGKVINSVGAGDSMVAGFLAGWLKTGDYETALRLGVAAGSASAFTEWLADRPAIEKQLAAVESMNQTR